MIALGAAFRVQNYHCYCHVVVHTRIHQDFPLPPTVNHAENRPALESLSRLPESYVPPIVAILPRMARNEAMLREAAKASGTSLERAF